MDLRKALMVMRDAAVLAGDMLLAMQPKSHSLVTRKDFLTDADLRSDDMICQTLLAEYPDVPYSSEEEPGEGIRKTWHWRIDPMDGTVNYFFGVDDWGVSVALVDDNDEAAAGVLYLPSQQKLFYAAKDSDTLLTTYSRRGQPQVSRPRVSEDASLATGCPVWLDWGKKVMDEDHACVVRILDRLRRRALYPNLRTGSVSNMAAVIEGRIGGFVFPLTDTYDAPATGLLVRQAGGRVTQLDGQPWNPFSTSVVATNGLIHAELLALVQE